MAPHRLCCLLVIVQITLSHPLTSGASSAGRSGFRHRRNESVSAILVFGDSTADPGNNNYVATIFRSNYPPYGRDFPDHLATGRFSNGRLVADFIAEYMGVKAAVPPYLDPSLAVEEMATGVSFASAGCGYDPLTPSLTHVIQISTQLDHFREYKSRLEQAIGTEKLRHLINDAVFVISAGTNDLVLNYFPLPVRRKQYTLPGYQTFLLLQTQHLIQSLWAEGARRIAVAGLPPMGCLPLVRTLAHDHLRPTCFEPYSLVARDYNRMLQDLLARIRGGAGHPGPELFYMDIYAPVLDMVQRPDKFGFEETSVGCCGTGLVETSFMCNPKTPACPDAAKYVFWDSIHPTERAYSVVFQTLTPTMDAIIAG